MEYTFSFTVAQFGGWCLAVCAAVVAINNAVNAAAGWIKRAKQPEESQNDRIKALEDRLLKVETKLTNDKVHLDALDTGNRVTQQALLALLGHAIDGNNIDQLTHARDNLHTYLVER